MTSHKLRAEWSFTLEGVEKTVSLGKALARAVSSPGVAAFFGGLGTGKTTLIQALGAALGLEDPVVSPSYTIVNHYPGGRLPLIHVDFFRLEKEHELLEIGIDELFSGNGLICVEWADHAARFLPGERLEIHLSCQGPERRGVRLRLFEDLWPRMDAAITGWIERNISV